MSATPLQCRNDRLHHPAQMQAPHHAIGRDFRKEASRVRADVDDAGMGACAEHNQSELLHMDDEHALVHQKRVGFPGSIGARAAEVIGAAFFKSAEPGNSPL